MATIQKRLRYRASVKVNGSPEEAKSFGREAEARRWARERTAAAVEQGCAPEAVSAEVRQKTSYRVMVRLRGHPAQYATFTRKTNAAKWAQKTEAAIREGRHFNAVESRKHTVGDLIDRYHSEILADKPEAKRRDQERHLHWWRERIGSYRLSAVTPALIAEQRSKLAKGTTVRHKKRSPATVNRYLISLSHAFTVAVREWGWLEQNPLRKVSKLKEPRGRVRFLSDEERDKLMTACRDSTEPRLLPLAVLAISTGARQGELLRLRWPDVDFQRGLAVLHETKNEERRAIPLAGPALKLLRGLSKVRRIDSDLVFAGPNGRAIFPRGPWERACEAAGIERDPRKDLQKRLAKMGIEVEAPETDKHVRELCERHGIGPETLGFDFHDLRHSAASYLAMNGATLAEIAEVLGHKTLAMVKRYSHLTEAHTAGVVARMNEAIFPNGSAG